MNNELEAMVQALHESGDYRVLKLLKPTDKVHSDDGSPKKLGVVIDVETTGLDTARDEPIELGIIKFEYSSEGRIFGIVDIFAGFAEPSLPIPPEVTLLTGITPEMVRGARIDSGKLAVMMSDVSLVIAHNAAYDRKIVERAWPGFVSLDWGCSATEVDWSSFGIKGAKLAYLLAEFGLFHKAHRAVDDCWAVLAILAQRLPNSSELVLSRLLRTSGQATYRIWAEGAPFERKDQLKSRGYKWSDGTGGRRKSWWIDVPEGDYASELQFLHLQIFGRAVNLPSQRIMASDRFSIRA